MEEPDKKKIKLSSHVEIMKEDKTEVDVNSKHEFEQKVGMRLFINNGHRFSGIVKQRFSDFIVRECDLDGNLIYLTDLNHCDHVLDTNKEVIECPIKNDALLTRISEFVQSKDKTKKISLDEDDDKEHRKLVHKYIKDTYKNIETDTIILENGSRAICLSFKSNHSQKNKRSSIKMPKYCHFVLLKQNRDTMECINILAKMLKINSSKFGYAGTKDRRATTIQKISVQSTLSQRLCNLNKGLRNVMLGNFSYHDKELKLGDLSGNEFIIVVRDVDITKDVEMHLTCKSLKQFGFINYFGLQRFGTGAVSTQDIGKALLASNYEKAVNMILKPRANAQKGNFESQAAAKEIWTSTKDAKKALKAITNKHSIEGKLMEGLSKQQNKNYNYCNAFQLLPRNTRLLYLHSYQSFVWNNAVSRRIEDFGLNPCVGDLVLAKGKDLNGYQMVLKVTADDIKMNKYSIYDIVLPLPGYDMEYSTDKMHDFYKECLAADGLDLDNMRNKNKELSLSGKYRQIVVKPSNMSWELIPYNDFTVSLVQNDYEKLTSEKTLDNEAKETVYNVAKVTSNNETKTTADTEASKSVDNETRKTAKYHALKLQFTLPSSCYATAALRELLVSETSYKAQVELNRQFKEKVVEEVK